MTMTSSFPKPVSVLIVEDSVVLRARLRALLAEERSINVVAEAASAVQALDRFHTHVPDAVVLDLRLEESSGLDVLVEIKKIAPQCVVIVLTSHNQTEFRQLCHRYGADHFFHKATEFERVAEVLSDLANRSSQQSTPPPCDSPGAPTP
jgi:DNA-binding NarL/FixJ family response regulator